MAINLGEIHFGLGPDTSRLRTAVRDIVNFGRATTAVAQSQVQGSQQYANALRRQEAAMVSAFQKTKAYQEAVTRSGMSQARASQLYQLSTTNLNLLVAQLQRGQISTLQFQRATEKFNLTLQTGQLHLKRFTEESKRMAQSGIVQFLQRMAQTSVLIAGPLSGAAARMTTFASVATAAGVKLAAFAAGAAATSLVLGKLSLSAIRVRREFEGFDLLLTSVTGDQEQANRQFERVIDLSNKTGVELQTLTRGWARLSAAAAGTNLEGNRAWQIFERVSFASAKLGSSAEETAGVLKALEQIISKGQLQAEELRGQLGDRLPGAVQIMAKALNIGTKELGDMMKQGQITSDSLVAFSEELAKRLGVDVTQAIDTLRAAEGRLNNEWMLMIRNLDELIGISDAYKNAVDASAGALHNFNEAIKVANSSSKSSQEFWTAWARTMSVQVLPVMRAMGMAMSVIGLRERIASEMMAANPFMGSEGYGWDDEIKQFASAEEFLNSLRQKPLDPLGGKGEGSDKGANRRAKSTRDAIQEIERLSQAYNRVFMNPQQAKWAEMQEEIVKSTSDFADKLRDAGVAASVASPLIAEYYERIKALKEAEYAAANTVTAMEMLGDAFEQAGSAATDAFIDALFNGENAMKALADVAKQTAASILKEMLKLSLINPILNSIFGGGLPTLGGLGGTGAISSPAFTGITTASTLFHSGTSYARAGGGPMRAVAASAFAGAPRLHKGLGLKRNEFTAILEEGEQVIPRGGGRGGTKVIINNYSGQQVTEERTQQGPDEIVNIVIGKVFDKMNQGGADAVMRGRYGVRPAQRKALV